MSGVFRLADSPVPTLVAEAIPYETYFLRPTNGLTSRALGCESGLSTIVANDPDATMTLTKWHAFRGFRFEETDCANLVVFQGNMTNRTLRRGSSERTEDARVWDIQVADFNFQMKRRVIRNADGNRPAETDIARLEWLLASDYTVNTEVIVADGIFDDANPVTMTANDYRGRFPVDVVTDCMGYSGKNAFVYAKPDGGDTAASWVGGFAYFVATDNIYTSSIKISNLLSDVDSSTIYAGSNDATLEKNAERVFSGVYLTYSGGKVYRQRQATIDAYGRIDASIDMPDIKTAAAATALADRYLNDYSFEEDIINVALLMPADKVNLILEGHAVQIKQTHWLGYEDYVWRRVAQRTVSQTPNPAKYLVNLELRDPRLIVGGNGSIPIPAGDINNQLPPPPTTNTFAITTCADKPATSFATVLATITMTPGDPSPPDNFNYWGTVAVHPTPGHYLTAEVTSATGQDSAGIGVPPTATYQHAGGGNDWCCKLGVGDPGTLLSFLGTAPSGEQCLLTWTDGGVANTWHAWPADGTLVSNGAFGVGRDAAFGLYGGAHFTTGVGSVTVVIREYATTTTSDTPPNTGQPSGFETPTGAVNGVNTTFTTAFAFFPGTLKVWVNGVDWTENIASVTATTFTLTNAPKTDSDILVLYQGA
jgi:hypothetical protein